MIIKLPESEGSVIGLEVSGTIDMQQENHWVNICNELIEKHENISILVILNGKINFGVDVLFKDLKWTFAHLKNMNKLAIVSNSTVLKWLVTVDSPFGKLAGISEKHFEYAKLQEAWQWVKE